MSDLIDYTKTMTISVPTGATHFSTMYCGDAPTFWRNRFTHYNTVTEEYMQPMYILQYYDGKRWVDDSTARSRRFRPTAEFDSWDPSSDCSEE